MKRGLKWGIGVSLVTLVAATACESQVGEDYDGEVQFSLQGTVHDAEEGMRPRLGFVSAGTHLSFVDGTVTGTFPSQFRFDVTEPPPPEALVATDDPATDGKLAFGYIVVMPDDAPDRIPYLTQATLEEICSDTEGSCVLHETACSSDGVCRERTLECEPCEIIGQVGDPALKDTGPYSSQGIGVGNQAFAVTSYCDDQENCYHEYTECEAGEKVGFEVQPLAGVQTCSIVEESGDASLSKLSELKIFARRYVVAYAIERVATELGTFEKGYNLVELLHYTRAEILEAPLNCDSEDEIVHCEMDLPRARIVDGTDVSIDLGFPPM